MRPTIPPARPKKNSITTKPMSPMGPASPDDGLDRPQNGKNRRNHHDGPENRHHKPDEDLDGKRRDDNQNQPRCRLPQHRRARAMSFNLRIHETSVPRRDRGLRMSQS